MRAGAAQKQSANGGFVARPIEHRAHGEELVESKFAVENVAAGEAVSGFEIERRDDLRGFDEVAKFPGEYSEIVLMTASPKFAACVSRSLFFNL